MKKVLFAAVAVLTFGFANAQKDVRFGLKGGLNVSTLAGDVNNANSKVGVHFGGLVEIKLAKKFTIQPELLLSLQGAKNTYSYSEPGYSFTSDNTLNLAYINVPVIAKYYVLPKLSLEAGPQLGILVSAKNKYSETEIDGNQSKSYSETKDIKGGLKGADAAFDFGASYYFTDNIFLEGRICVGIASIDNNGNYYGNGNKGNNYYNNANNVTNNVFQLSFGYRF